MEHVVKRARVSGDALYIPQLPSFFSRGPVFSTLFEHEYDDSTLSSMYLSHNAIVQAVFVAAAGACSAVVAADSVPVTPVAEKKERKPRSNRGVLGTSEERKAKQNNTMACVMREAVEGPLAFKKEFRLHPEDFYICLARIRPVVDKAARETSIDPFIKFEHQFLFF